MTRAIVLGAGMMGATIAAELSDDPEMTVAVADNSREQLNSVKASSKIERISIDLSEPVRLGDLVASFDIVFGALPGRLGFSSLRAVVGRGKPMVDISFMKEDALALDEVAKDAGVTAVVDCGVAPGLSNLIIGYCHAQLEITEVVEYFVGGLPKVRRWPYQYKAPFSPADVIEGYTRPARMIENGQMVVKPALSDPEMIDFPGVGTLEGSCTDGLRSLLHTVRARSMKEKTLRYPGHRDLMLVLRESGFLRKEPVAVNGIDVAPLDVTSRLLFPIWTLDPLEEEFTVLRVIVEGLRGGRRVRYTYDLYDEFDRTTGTTSMARTTGYPCAIIGRMLARGMYREPGVHPPEDLGGQPGILPLVLEALKRRGVVVQHREETVGQ